MRVREIMTTSVVTVRPEITVKEAAALLVDRGINAVPVTDDAGGLVGILSEGDLVVMETQPDPRTHEIPAKYRHDAVPHVVADVMTRDVVALPQEADVAEAARLMLRRRIKQIPIVRDGQLVGIVSRRDLLRVFARDDGEIRRELQELLDGEIELVGLFEAQVIGGVAMLKGPRERESRRLAEFMARSVPGVVAVEFAEVLVP